MQTAERTATDWAAVKVNRSQKLMTVEQARKIPALYSQDGKGFDAIVYVKFFAGAFTWYATEFCPADGVFFGYVKNDSDPMGSEWGYFSVAELVETSNNSGMRRSGDRLYVRPMVERDIRFKPCSLREVLGMPAAEPEADDEPEAAEPAANVAEVEPEAEAAEPAEVAAAEPVEAEPAAEPEADAADGWAVIDSLRKSRKTFR